MEADQNPSPKDVVTTATYNEMTFHLFQVVKIRPRPMPGDWSRQWVVISLDGGVTVGTIGPDETRNYDPDGEEFDNLTPVTEGDAPVYGH